MAITPLGMGKPTLEIIEIHDEKLQRALFYFLKITQNLSPVYTKFLSWWKDFIGRQTKALCFTTNDRSESSDHDAFRIPGNVEDRGADAPVRVVGAEEPRRRRMVRNE